MERGEQNGTRRMGKGGLRTREPSIMHVPRPRCDRQINSMENVEAKKNDRKARLYEGGNIIRGCSLCRGFVFRPRKNYVDAT